jgi:phosphatidylglycerol:prolipoprotein diacylglycerol transferase
MNVNGTFHHPTFLYESLWNLAGLLVLLVLRRRPFLRAGELLMSYFIWYSVGRFFIEGLRTDSLAFNGPSWLASLMDSLWSPMTVLFQQGYLDPAYGNVRISQLLAVILVIAAIAIIIIRRMTGAAKEHYLDPIINLKTGLPAGESPPSGKKGPEAAEHSAPIAGGPHAHDMDKSAPDAGTGVKE